MDPLKWHVLSFSNTPSVFVHETGPIVELLKANSIEYPEEKLNGWSRIRKEDLVKSCHILKTQILTKMMNCENLLNLKSYNDEIKTMLDYLDQLNRTGKIEIDETNVKYFFDCEYTAENLATHNVLPVTGAPWVFVCETHPVIALLRVNSDALSIDVDKQSKVDGEWYKISKQVHEEACKILKNMLSKKVISQFNLKQLDAQEWSEMKEALVETF
jgi:hypothetical protein